MSLKKSLLANKVGTCKRKFPNSATNPTTFNAMDKVNSWLKLISYTPLVAPVRGFSSVSMHAFSVVGHPSCMSVRRCPRGTQVFEYINQSLAGLVLQMLIHCTNTVYGLICVSSMEFLSLLSPSVQFSHSVVSNSLRDHGLQHARLPCPSPTPRACSNSCPLSQWYHPTISSSVSLFSSWLQSFPASGSFPMSQFFTSGRAKVLEF